MDPLPKIPKAPHKDWRYYVVICAYLLLDRLIASWTRG
jgi:hypothetical protein